MRIEPIIDPAVLHKGLAAVPVERQALVDEAIRREEAEVLSFLPGVDTTRVTFRNIELCTYILHYNFRQLLRLPSLGLIDQKSNFSSIYDNMATLQRFMSTQGVKMLNYKVVAEIMLLYGLNASAMKRMSAWCCTFQQGPGKREPDFEKLSSIYTKRQLVQQIKEHIDPAATKMFPPRILKGMEYLSYADFLHVFQSVGQDPFFALERFVKKETNLLTKFGIGGIKEDAFVLTPLDEEPAVPAPSPASVAAQPEDPKIEAPAEPVSETAHEEPSSETPAELPVPETAPESPAPEIPAAEPTPSPAGPNEEPVMIITPSPQDEEMAAQFALVVNNAVRAMGRHAPVNLADNILSLRKGVSEGNTAGFDALFLSSGCTRLDVFNYAARVSAAYGVPLYDLFYQEIAPGQYQPKQAFTAPEYTYEDISNIINPKPSKLRFPVTDASLFDLLVANPTVFLPRFGEVMAGPAKPVQASRPKEEDKAAETKEKERITMNVKMRLRICTPCDADAWENDNPDRTAPGFHWDNAGPEVSEQARRCVELHLSSGQLDLPKVKEDLSALVAHPYKAQVQASGDGCRMTLELF